MNGLNINTDWKSDMLFIERRHQIGADNSKDSKYIADFNVDIGKERSFFLNSEDWDKFIEFMNNKKPEILLVLKYDTRK
jgi:hypothetical protein